MSATSGTEHTAEKVTAEIMEKAAETMALARTLIHVCWPFLSPAASRLVLRWTPSAPTLGVDRHWRLYANPVFVAAQSIHRLALLIAGHELQHALGEHSDRLIEYRDTFIVTESGHTYSLANWAHDLAINSSLKSFAKAGDDYWQKEKGYNFGISANLPNHKPGELNAPPEILYPENLKDVNGNPYPTGLISEGYAELLSTLPQGPPIHGAGCGKCGSGAGDPNSPWEDPSPPDPNDASSGVTRMEAEVIRQEVATAALEQEKKHPGTVPGNIVRWAEIRLRPPKNDYKTVFRRRIRREIDRMKGKLERTYARPNRRGLAMLSDVVMQGFDAPAPRFVAVLDTSGSMSVKDFEIAFSELRGALLACGYRRVPVLCCDAAVYKVQHIKNISEIDMRGGEGTDMAAGIQAAAAKPINAKLIIVFTDGITPWPINKPPGTEVIIVLTQPPTGNYQPPEWARVLAGYDEVTPKN